MEEEDDYLSIYERKAAIQRELNQIDFITDQKGYNYEFVGREQLLLIINPLFDKYKVDLIISAKSTEILVRNFNKYDKKLGREVEATEYLTKGSMVFKLVCVDNPEDFIETPWESQGSDSSERGIGNMYTYALRYYIMTQFRIQREEPLGKDYDLSNPEDIQLPIEHRQLITKIHRWVKMRRIESSPFIVRLKEKYGVTKLARLNYEQLQELENSLANIENSKKE